ncbi:MAG: polysaccharide deacetylase family protein [Fibrobacter sp.]|uniref:polysaccharide deacetylase family protein n=1 Tax=Fibrobacter sp. TaxID=35828 RepID=UPI002A909DE9|nr:polysaccharide deacetylase family protein [Fibrobacter sp.]MDY6264978.1 polysaccharide deacetylase family protein [Fibrobacter sp.]
MDYKKLSVAALIALGSSMVFAQDAEIATWAGFRKAAVSFTFDDGPQSDVDVALPMFEKYGYKATFNIVTNWANGGGGNGMLNWSGVQKLSAAGHEIASHSDSHPNGKPMPSNEISSSKGTISQKIQQKYGVVTLAYPNCDTPGDAQVLQNYVVGRICNGSWKGGSDIMGKDGPSNWAAVSALMTGNQGTSDFKGNMDKAVQQGGWVAFLTHGFQNKTNGFADYSPTDANGMDGALQYAQQKDKDIWVAPMGYVAMYIKERNASKIEPQDGGAANSMAFELKHSIADNISKYDYPLSIKVKTDWSKVEVTQDGAKLESKVDGGYVYFDAVPNAGSIVVKDANASVESSSSSEVESSSSEFLCDALIPGCGDNPWAIAPEIQDNFHFAVYRSSDNYIVVSGAQGHEITVFNSLGHKLRTTRGLGAEQKVYTGAKGVYIVKVGNKTRKVKL